MTHYNDPVPRLPPAMMGFAHYTPEFYISAKNKDPVSIAQVVKIDAAAASTKGNEQFKVLDVQAHRCYFNAISACYAANTEKDNSTVPDLASSWAPSIIKLMGNNSGIILVDSAKMTAAMMAALVAAGSVDAANGVLSLIPGGGLVKPFVPGAATTGGLVAAGMSGLTGLLGSMGLGSGPKTSSEKSGYIDRGRES